MFELLWLVPALPFAGFLVLALFGGRLTRRLTAVCGVGSVGISAGVAVTIAVRFIASPPPGHVFTQSLWTWMQVGGFRPEIAFTVDALAVVMMLVVTVVGWLIHLYSAEFMEDDEGYARFFAYMNLFVGSMLTLVLADNLLLLYLGWEGVGLCSYLLIGFWYQDPVNGRAARKAFVVTRVGDTAMAIGLFLIFTKLGTMQIHSVLERASEMWPVGSGVAVAAAALLLGGAVGKSAQLPLQTWLPDAMAGPTPVSALIHAATMVTAGVYLIARMHTLFELAPSVLSMVAAVGAVTLLIAGFSALTQRDIKRILAYSTISQIGYMFLALGIGAWSAAIFHLMTHAFFKALLFLGAGAVILAVHHEHDIFKMGGLRRELPVTFWTFLIAAASLSGLPLVTAGFYSKDLILWKAWSSEQGNVLLWIAGYTGAFLTSLYIFRLVFVAFFGEAKTPVEKRPGRRIHVPLIVLGILSLVGGLVEIPPTLGDVPLFSHFMESALPASHETHGLAGEELGLQALAGVASLVGIYLAYLWIAARRRKPEPERTPFVGRPLHRFWFSGWGFDTLYDVFFVKPYNWIAAVNRSDFVDWLYRAIAWLARGGHATFRRTQTGVLRWYAVGLALGSVFVLTVVLFL